MSSIADGALSQSAQAKIKEITQKAQQGKLDWSTANAMANSIRNQEGANYTVSSSGKTTYANGGVYDRYGYAPPGSAAYGAGRDLESYLESMYAANMEQQLRSLRSSYRQNTAALEQSAAAIPKAFDDARNRTAAQSQLQQQAFDEYAAARGLNSGASGQAALSRSGVLQGNLSNLDAQQAKAQSDHKLELDRLAIAYEEAVNEIKATGNAQLAGALYQEYVRQAGVASKALSDAQSQANWERQFDAGNASSNRSQARTLVLRYLSAGQMPPSDLLLAAGLSQNDLSGLVW